MDQMAKYPDKCLPFPSSRPTTIRMSSILGSAPAKPHRCSPVYLLNVVATRLTTRGSDFFHAEQQFYPSHHAFLQECKSVENEVPQEGDRERAPRFKSTKEANKYMGTGQDSRKPSRVIPGVWSSAAQDASKLWQADSSSLPSFIEVWNMLAHNQQGTTGSRETRYKNVGQILALQITGEL